MLLGSAALATASVDAGAVPAPSFVPRVLLFRRANVACVLSDSVDSNLGVLLVRNARNPQIRCCFSLGVFSPIFLIAVRGF